MTVQTTQHAMKSKLAIQILHTGNSEIRAAARTLSRSFSNDPLISWMYKPNAQHWDELNPQTQKWQERRIARAAITGIVMAAMGSGTDGKDGCLGLMMVRPPQAHSLRWQLSPRRWWDSLRLRIQELLDAAEDQSCDLTRVDIMYSHHKQLMAKYASDMHRCWYLEVIAVSPEAQGRGIGRRMMTWLQELTKENEFILLECTAAGNVPIYEKLGFKVVESVEMEQGESKMREWVMTWSRK